MLKFLIVIVAGFILYKMVTMDKKKKSEKAETDVRKKAATGEMVKDPICGAFVPVDGDIRVKNGEKVECFCSYECREKYLKQIGHTPEIAPEAEADEEDDE